MAASHNWAASRALGFPGPWDWSACAWGPGWPIDAEWQGWRHHHTAREPDFRVACANGSGGRDYYAAACGSSGNVGAGYRRVVDCPECVAAAVVEALLAAVGIRL